MTDTILREHHEGVLTLVLNRPEKRNALSAGMYLQLATALQEAAGSDAVRAVLLLGTSGAFCSGNELESFLGEGQISPDHPVFVFMAALADFPKPVVAALDGMAVGIGATLLLHCDLVYATARTRLQFPFARLGLCPEFASSVLLPRIVGRAFANEALLLGEPISADKAHAWGLINEVLPESALLDHARNRVQALALLPPAAVAVSKRLLRAGDASRVHEAIQREQHAFLTLLATPEVQQGLRTFLAERKARA